MQKVPRTNNVLVSIPIVVPIALLIMIGTLLNTATLCAQTDEVNRGQFEKITEEYSEAVEEAVGDKSALRKLRSKTSKQLLELADECQEPELAIEMLNWVIKRNGQNRKSKQALRVIIDRFLDQPGIGDALTSRATIEDLETVLEKNSDTSVVAVANFLRAMKNKDEEAREKVLLDLSENHGDVIYRGAPLEKLLVGPLAELRFGVGKIAPDITGPDTDDVEFSLSDYRGKVVVIDFWGDW